MNIDQYRAMKAQEAEQANSKVEEQPNAQAVESPTTPVQPSVQETPQIEPTQQSGGDAETTQGTSSENKPTELSFVEIDGQQVSIDELKNGYLRQSDYTRKTQELAQQRRDVEQANEFLERLKQNPELAQQLGYDPQQAEIERIQQQNSDLLLERELMELSTKYDDFDEQAVLQVAFDRHIDNLEDAYLLYKQLNPVSQQQAETVQAQQPVLDVEAIKAELRAELLKELNANQDTSTLITSNGGSAPTTPQAPQLSEAELKVARNMGMTPEEYARWR